jgi:hypothetical protein
MPHWMLRFSRSRWWLSTIMQWLDASAFAVAGLLFVVSAEEHRSPVEIPHHGYS